MSKHNKGLLLLQTDYHATDQMRRPQPTQSWAPAFDRFSRQEQNTSTAASLSANLMENWLRIGPEF